MQYFLLDLSPQVVVSKGCRRLWSEGWYRFPVYAHLLDKRVVWNWIQQNVIKFREHRQSHFSMHFVKPVNDREEGVYVIVSVPVVLQEGDKYLVGPP